MGAPEAKAGHALFLYVPDPHAHFPAKADANGCAGQHSPPPRSGKGKRRKGGGAAHLVAHHLREQARVVRVVGRAEDRLLDLVHVDVDRCGVRRALRRGREGVAARGRCTRRRGDAWAFMMESAARTGAGGGQVDTRSERGAVCTAGRQKGRQPTSSKGARAQEGPLPPCQGARTHLVRLHQHRVGEPLLHPADAPLDRAPLAVACAARTSGGRARQPLGRGER